MANDSMTIGELADAAGISRRAVRFYVQRGLIAAPTGLGRGGHYSQQHLEQLRQIRERQAAGYSLDAIAKLMAGGVEQAPTPAATPRRRAAVMTASLWTRVRLADGLELHLDSARHNPSVEQLLAIRDAVRAILTVEKVPPLISENAIPQDIPPSDSEARRDHD